MNPAGEAAFSNEKQWQKVMYQEGQLNTHPGDQLLLIKSDDPQPQGIPEGRITDVRNMYIDECQ
jgi:hypothetical protein